MPLNEYKNNNFAKEIIFVKFLNVAICAIGGFTVVDYFVFNPAVSYVLGIFFIVLVFLKILLKSNKISHNSCGFLIACITIFYTIPFASFFSGGLSSPIIPWVVIIPIASILLFGNNRKTLFFTSAVLLVVVIFTVLSFLNVKLPEYDLKEHYIGLCISIVGVISFVFLLTWLFEKQKNEALKSVEDEKSLFLTQVSQMPGVVFQLQVFKDGSKKFNFVSDSVQSILGISAKKYIANAQLFFESVHVDDIKILEEGLIQSIRTQEKWIYKVRKIVSDNEVIHVKGRATPQMQKDGSVIFFGYENNVTVEKNAEKALLESQLNFTQITNSITDAVYLYDVVNNKYLFISPNCKEVLGVEDRFFYEGNNYTEQYIYGADKELSVNAKTKIANGNTFDIEFRIVVSGEIRWIQEKSFSIKDSKGIVVKNSGSLTDITQRKLAEEELHKSKTYMQQISNTINDVFFLYDVIEKKYLFISTNCLKILGVADTFFYGNKDYTSQFVHEDDKQKLIDAYSVLETNMEYDLDYRIIINGAVNWVNEKSFAIKDDEGKFVKMSGIVTDINSRKIDSEKIIKTQQGLEEAQKLANLGNWEYNFIDDTFIWSAQTYRIFELENDIKNYGLYSIFEKKVHPEDLKIIKLCVKKIFATKKNQVCEYRLICNNGDIKYVSAIVEPVLSKKNNKVVGLKGSVQDVTKHHLAVQAKSNFLSTMSHEIRTPINGVIGISNLLMAEKLTPLQKEYVDTLNFSAQHLSNIVSDILDFSKIESGSFTFEKVSFDLELVCSNIIKLFEAQAKDKSIMLTFNPIALDGFSLNGDYVRLSQILTNLLSNAIKFTNAGSVSLSYKPIKQDNDTVTLQFIIKDSGIGIPMQQQQQIFEGFLQADDSITRKYGGTGLGLTICKKLVELQGGKIYVESENEKGSTFTVELIFEKHNYADESIKKLPSQVIDYTSLSGMKILVAEDNKINAMVLTRFLTKWKIENNVVEDGEKAIIALNNEYYDMVLMDLQMPIMDGKTATINIRQSSDTKINTIPIVALTADALIDSQRDLLKNGFNDCVTKPFSPDVLFKVLHKYYKVSNLSF